MKKSILVFGMLMALTLMCLPADTTVSAQEKHNKAQKMGRVGNGNIYQPGKNQPGKNGVWRKKNSYGYKNYGQYRKTQVGNRRSHLVKRTYWRNGERLTRLIRVFY